VRHSKWWTVLAATAITALAASACSSSSPNSGGGKAASGGTAVFAEAAGATPDCIFPMYEGACYTTTNIEQFMRLSFRPLYWVGDNGQPVIDPALSMAALPTYSDNNTVVTINMNNYKWSDGAPVDARDVGFWINMLRANKSNFAAYIAGEFPDNLKSYKIVNANTIVLTLTGTVNPTWFTNDQLSMITPLPVQAWDKTSASGAVGNYDETASGAVAVFNYLTSQTKDLATYGSNPLWKVVDGPWELVAYQSDGYAKFAANPKYSGPIKPKLAYFVEQPFTSDAAELNVLRSGNTISYGYIPAQDASQTSALQSQGYDAAAWNIWGTSYIPLNFNDPADSAIVKQLYIRQAMQSLVDQPSFVSGPFKGYGNVAYGPIPVHPSNPYVTPYEAKGPWPYSPATAIRLLSSHGWVVKPNGVTTCKSPGTASNECGAGIHAGAGLSFSLNYINGNVEASQEMQGLQSNFSQAGVQINLSTSPFDTVVSKAAPCKPSASCSWEMAYWGSTIYGVDPYPTGDQIFASSASSNYGNYDSATADQMIAATVHGTASLATYENYLANQIPVLWMPESTYQISEISSDLHGALPQSPILQFTPENWYLTK
jgi:peptide/nickel transport system substrate-binding protein